MTTQKTNELPIEELKVKAIFETMVSDKYNGKPIRESVWSELQEMFKIYYDKGYVDATKAKDQKQKEEIELIEQEVLHGDNPINWHENISIHDHICSAFQSYKFRLGKFKR